ncbi:RNA polymerase sigma factor RpoE [Streptomyces sp. YIM 130001]|uniref:sigma-70 family RNA polymerase sigma factor n=1 Tax=Streptomyces sp. YIM 130001 TaxID=2259644 RepID=UPI000E652BB5|nr:sigma-70 family RNA polymerase sigma factor [Streptomyces sp. YIM 130001]RII20216.1 RNA polymerase sigma factor RpoE [Streptomyces sp. YIM 130001]
MSSERDTALIRAAQAGEQQAQDRLVAAYLPLVYNIVGRALNGHADVDDVVQETMIRMLGGLPALRDPDTFRSWLVAITMNQIRGHWRERRFGAIPGGGLHEAHDVADPGVDFVDLTIVRLGLSGQRREVAEATRWLDEDDRALLSLWWLEAAGELSRAEVAAALELSAQHTAVRVQRMKAQLETARVVVRALYADPRCVLLADLVAGWDGSPSALWRKRIARHARGCTACSGHWSGLVPAEGLLVGLALVPAGAAGAHFAAGGVGSGGSAPTAASYQAGPDGGYGEAGHSADTGFTGASYGDPGVSGPVGGHTPRRRKTAQGRRTTVVAAVAVLAAAGGAVYLSTWPDQDERERDTVGARSAAVSPTTPSRTPEASPGKTSEKPSPKPSKSSAKPSPKPTTAKPTKKPAPKPEPKPTRPAAPAPSGKVEQVVALVNSERAKQGCGPVTANSTLHEAGRRHSVDMAARDYFDHTSPDGKDPGDRITAAGYRWSTYGENIARGQQTAAQVMEGWMNSEGHRANILNCSFKEIGVGIHEAGGGPWWTQVFGAKL